MVQTIFISQSHRFVALQSKCAYSHLIPVAHAETETLSDGSEISGHARSIGLNRWDNAGDGRQNGGSHRDEHRTSRVKLWRNNDAVCFAKPCGR